ncbi:protein DEK-like isoform X1 [Ruditapes philippinarum]|uniref:protein DEK-like isoform X1 n=1 Tax=Ruditapes philippinarum TaxID=129788 RepID=UPI00295BB2C3|nr:protein DEK-like isoform X1 [Ruditapes philippinarum]
MSDESSEQISSGDTSKKEMEEQSEGTEHSDTEKTDNKKEKDTTTKDDDENDDDDENVSSGDDEEVLPAGLLEKPVVIEDGKKRERKKVERITFESARPASASVEIKEGKGRSLGDIPFIEHKLGRMKSEDCKPLHRILYRRLCTNLETKKNIRQFSGFPFSKDDKEYEKRMEMLKSKKFSLTIVKKMMEILDIPRTGTKNELITRLMEWLEKPTDSGRKVPAPKRKRSAGGDKKKRVRKTKKKAGNDVADSDNESEEAADESDDNKDDDGDDDDKKADSSDEEEEEEVKTPPKKKAKKSLPKPTKEKKPRTPKATNKKKLTPKKKKEVSEDEDVSSSSDDEPLVAKKKSKGPPTNDELKDVIKKMLDNANLEQVTMKTVLKNVFAKYPDYDLLDRKDFIKNTVKQIIS